ncbi:MAG: hypothetical protein ACE5K7_03325, partial [Phycisphaerae bacterium]
AGRRVLVGIRCDGRDVSPAQIEEVLSQPAHRYERLEFQTGSPRRLAADALQHAAELFAETHNLAAQAVELLNQGQTTRAMELLGSCLSIWNQVSESVRKTVRLLGLDLDSMVVGQQPLPELFSALREQLGSIRDALEARDYVLLADILQYELPGLAQRWQQMISTIRQQVAPSDEQPPAATS